MWEGLSESFQLPKAGAPIQGVLMNLIGEHGERITAALRCGF
jgi:hypothetical protein